MKFKWIEWKFNSLGWEQTVKYCSTNIVTFHVWNRWWKVCGVKNHIFSTKKCLKQCLSQFIISSNKWSPSIGVFYLKAKTALRKKTPYCLKYVWRLATNDKYAKFKCLKNHVWRFAPSFTVDKTKSRKLPAAGLRRWIKNSGISFVIRKCISLRQHQIADI